MKNNIGGIVLYLFKSSWEPQPRNTVAITKAFYIPFVSCNNNIFRGCIKAVNPQLNNDEEFISLAFISIKSILITAGQIFEILCASKHN